MNHIIPKHTKSIHTIAINQYHCLPLPSCSNETSIASSTSPTSTTTTTSASASAPPSASVSDELLQSPTSASPLTYDVAAPSPTSSASASSASSSPSAVEDFNYNQSPHSQERSMFSFNPQLLRPFMGLKQVGHEDDPWRHKPYNLYQPIYTGGGTFESLLNRYRRHISNNPPNSPQLKHVLTPGMLERLLRIKVNFEKNYPFLYKTMMGHLLGDKHTTLTITPPEIPDQVSYPNVELAAAEIDQLEKLVEQLKQQQQHQHQHHKQQHNEHQQQHPEHQYQHQQQHQYQQQHHPHHQSYQQHLDPQSNPEQQVVWDPSSFNQEMLEPLMNSYNEEKNFWDQFQDPAPESNSFWHQFQDSSEVPNIRKRASFWSELEAAEERGKHRHQIDSTDNLDNLFNFDEEFN